MKKIQEINEVYNETNKEEDYSEHYSNTNEEMDKKEEDNYIEYYSNNNEEIDKKEDDYNEYYSNNNEEQFINIDSGIKSSDKLQKVQELKKIIEEGDDNDLFEILKTNSVKSSNPSFTSDDEENEIIFDLFCEFAVGIDKFFNAFQLLLKSEGISDTNRSISTSVSY